MAICLLTFVIRLAKKELNKAVHNYDSDPSCQVPAYTDLVLAPATSTSAPCTPSGDLEHLEDKVNGDHDQPMFAKKRHSPSNSYGGVVNSVFMA